ncbi:hypothetical protein Q1695_008502 [Nippostrongylus brasiliensis]|nr:hypothetical protein Q1695_008502 [Nippostrongylus brasiliensis]
MDSLRNGRVDLASETLLGTGPTGTGSTPVHREIPDPPPHTRTHSLSTAMAAGNNRALHGKTLALINSETKKIEEKSGYERVERRKVGEIQEPTTKD